MQKTMISKERTSSRFTRSVKSLVKTNFWVIYCAAQKFNAAKSLHGSPLHNTRPRASEKHQNLYKTFFAT